ncbi:MAG: PAS domain-containing protein [Bdellovibrionales bacterium]|nr:PAS domain-containing protein [Bdellovibrionales bacterium]
MTKQRSSKRIGSKKRVESRDSESRDSESRESESCESESCESSVEGASSKGSSARGASPNVIEFESEYQNPTFENPTFETNTYETNTSKAPSIPADRSPSPTGSSTGRVSPTEGQLPYPLPAVVSYCLSSDLSTLLFCSSNIEEILGCSLHQVRNNGALFLRHIHSDDKFRVLNTLEESLLTKRPVSIAYRWVNPKTGVADVLVNHCSVAFSEHGEVLSGLILHLRPEIAEEIGFVSGTRLHVAPNNRSLSDNRNVSGENSCGDASATLVLDDYLQPYNWGHENGKHHPRSNLSHSPKADAPPSSSDLGRFLSSLMTTPSEFRIVQHLHSSLQSGASQESSVHLFEGAQVLLLSLRRISEETFTPYYLLSLFDVSHGYIEEEELKALRQTRGVFTALETTLSDLHAELSQLRTKDFPQRSMQGAKNSIRYIDEIRAKLSACEGKPFVDCSEVVLSSLNEIAKQIPSWVAMKVEIPPESFSVWRTVAEYMSIQLREIGEWTIQCGSKSSYIRISLDRPELSVFALYIEFRISKKTLGAKASLPEDRFAKLTPIPDFHRLTRTLVVHDSGEDKVYEVRLQSNGCFSEAEFLHSERASSEARHQVEDDFSIGARKFPPSA